MQINAPVISVSEINNRIKTVVESDLMLGSFLIGGEISNFTLHRASGHMYFSLKDEKTSIKAVMFSGSAKYLDFTPANGMKVIALGKIGVFERDGIYQVYVSAMQPDGSGALAEAFEQLKKKLEKMGYFDPSHKKKIPAYPKNIGVITSPTGAAVRDIFNILERRWPVASVYFENATVQGPGAPATLISALKKLDESQKCDVIIIGRGGGSAEDLWCFNDEMLARAIYECTTPVISGVGHETDFTVCDFVSDLRAPTPSAAAELATPDINSELMTAAALTNRLYSSFSSYLEYQKKLLASVTAGRSFTSPGKFFESERARIETLNLKLGALSSSYLSAQKTRLRSASAGLEAMNPLSVLLRGYGAVKKDNKIAVSVKSFAPGDDIEIFLSDGSLSCTVESITEKSNE